MSPSRSSTQYSTHFSRSLVCCALLVAAATLSLAQGSKLEPKTSIGSTPVIRTPVGSFIGRNANKTSHFLGIRYATSERFEAAQPFSYEPTQVESVKEYAPVCWQRVARDLPSAGRDEDCLFVNVWAPQAKIDEIASGVANVSLLPVVVWIHGGGFVVGSGTNAVVDGVSLNRQNVILVSFNYRLGLFGFWKHDKLKNSNQTVTSNFGLHDQQLALEWVRDNIASFGGNPDSVTALGESAGGISILHHLTSSRMISDAKLGRPKLFHRAWIISAILIETPFLESPEAEAIGAEWALVRGCSGDDVIECMKSKAPAELVDPLTRWSAFDFDTTRATIYSIADKDFPLIPVALRQGQFDRDVPLVIGSSMEDGSLFAWFSFPVYGPEKPYLDYVISRSFEGFSSRVMDQYPSEKYPTEYWRFSDILTDVAWHCPAATVASKFADMSTMPARRYVFNYRFNDSSDLFGIFHASELTLIFENPSGTYLFPRYFTEAESRFSNYIASTIARYARDEITDAEWPRYDSQEGTVLIMGNHNSTDISQATRFRQDKCKFWNTELPRGILSFPKSIYAEEGWRSNILNNIFWTFSNYEEHLTQRNGVIALIFSLLAASIVVKIVSRLSAMVGRSKSA